MDLEVPAPFGDADQQPDQFAPSDAGAPVDVAAAETNSDSFVMDVQSEDASAETAADVADTVVDAASDSPSGGTGCKVGGPAEVLFQGPDGIANVAVYANDVYFATADDKSPATWKLFKCPKSGCNGSPVTLVKRVETPILYLVADAEDVYWDDTFDNGAIQSCSSNGCGGVPTTVASPLSDPGAMAMDSTSLFWLGSSAFLTAPAPSVSRCEKSNCAATLTTLASGISRSGGIAIDESSVYWSQRGAALNQYSLLKCPKSGCAGSPIAYVTSQPYVGGIALDATNVYWSGVAAGSSTFLWTCRKGGCSGAPQRLASLPYGGFGLTFDGGNLYWLNSGGELARCATPGCAAPVRLASGKGGTLGGPGQGLAVDESCVYWGTGASVMRVAK
jgi:hypothetical protein